jgi:hypothetical protein
LNTCTLANRKEDKMEREPITTEELFIMLEKLGITMNETLGILKEVVLGKRKPADFVASNIILIVQIFYLANCDLQTDDQKRLQIFEENLRVRFDFLKAINTTHSLLPNVKTKDLRELALIAIQTRDGFSLEQREEYANNFITFLAIKAEQKLGQKNRSNW